MAVRAECVAISAAPALRLHAARSSVFAAGPRLLHPHRCHYKQRRPRGVVTALNARTRLRSAEHMFFQRRSSERRSSTTSWRSAAVALLFDHLIGVVRVFHCLGVSISCLETEVEPAATPRATTHSGWRGSNRRALWLRLRARARFRGQRRGAAAAAQNCVASRPENIDPKGCLSSPPRSCRRSLSLVWTTLFFSAPLSSGGFTDRRSWDARAHAGVCRCSSR